MRVESLGHRCLHTAACYLDCFVLYIKSFRGSSIISLEPTRLLVLSSRAYYVWASHAYLHHLFAPFEALPSGYVGLAVLVEYLDGLAWNKACFTLEFVVDLYTKVLHAG